MRTSLHQPSTTHRYLIFSLIKLDFVSFFILSPMMPMMGGSYLVSKNSAFRQGVVSDAGYWQTNINCYQLSQPNLN